MTVRMKDIARDLGISPMAVSKALRNHKDIGEATKARVRKRAEMRGARKARTRHVLLDIRERMARSFSECLAHRAIALRARKLERHLREFGRQGGTITVAANAGNRNCAGRQIFPKILGSACLVRRQDTPCPFKSQFGTGGFRDGVVERQNLKAAQDLPHCSVIIGDTGGDKVRAKR